MTATLPGPVRPVIQAEPPRLIWLEITGRCQLTCSHCYAGSSPHGSQGTMTLPDWEAVIAEAAAVGVEQVCLIGGEPTLRPDFPALVAAALDANLAVEVFTNLYTLPAAVWDALVRPGVSVATSYYADDAARHDKVTGRAGSHARTRAQLRRLVAAEVPVRAGIIATAGEEQALAAFDDLTALGVVASIDQVRPFGRAADHDDEAGTCGHCGHGTAAVGPDGTVTPCVFTRRAAAGNVRDGLAAVLAGTPFRSQVARLDAARTVTAASGCGPDICGPKASTACGPTQSQCKPKTPDCEPRPTDGNA
ncbi:radical SAM/SPASM domain-containing protein [Frankia sp. CiP3]|uniref:radical SAM/SPASM domain-containing protein n=1 Tax=Frankia sp. CiP3 TaxID=2880971 RepID=UPI001EF51C75|nr:radical SAM/SPASM domain-containing protein [Frankia sp. CiP3]